MKRGFTLAELIIVIGMLAILTVLTTVNLLRPQHQASTIAAVATLIADLRQQQLKAMLGDTEGSGSPASYGIFLGSNQYTLFRGSSYSAGNPSNFSVSLESPIQTTTTFPSSQIVWQAGSGEVAGFTPGSNTIGITNINSSTTSILTINRYGTTETVD